MSEQPQRPTSNDDRDGWKAYWAAQGMPWRTEPEIDEERQRYLAERRAVKPDIEKGVYPFRDERGSIKLTRADVEWLIATLPQGPGVITHQNPNLHLRSGIDLCGADLMYSDLSRLPLAEMAGGLSSEYWFIAAEEQREDAAIHLEGAQLQRSDLTLASLRSAHLEQADLRDAFLSGATLRGAHLGTLDSLDTSRGIARNGVGSPFSFADLRRVYFDASSTLDSVILGGKTHGFVRLADIRWGSVNLATVAWSRVDRLGDEHVARNRRTQAGKLKGRLMRNAEYTEAARAYLQLSNALRNQGIREQADRFAYRAQVCQRIVLRRQRRFLRYLGSLFLALISGYGYRPLRSFITYLVVVGAFAGVYALLAHFGLTAEHFGSWDSPLVLSVTSFHGRVFFAGGLPLTDWAARVGAVEAAIGLLVEITFIATFTQRFFAR